MEDLLLPRSLMKSMIDAKEEKYMKRIMIILMAVAMSAFAAFTLTGCGISASGGGLEEGKETSVSLVIGNHACSKGLNLNSPGVKEKVSDAIRAYGFVSLVNADGKPELIAADNYDIPERYKHADEQKLKSDADAKTLALLQKVSTVTADDPETDVLESLRVAVRSLANGPDGTGKAVIVIDTGLSTTGFLDFRNNLLDGDPEQIVRALSEKHAIPDLTNTTVYWQQMGDVAAPQAELSPVQRIKMEEIWRAVIEAGGGSLVVTEAVPNNSILGEGLPPVSVVEIETESSIRVEPSQPETTSPALQAQETSLYEPDFQTAVVFGKEEVLFVGNSSEYADEAAVAGILTPVSDYLKENTDIRLLIIGTTAGDESGDFEMDLSYARAEAVKNTLIQLGVDGSQLLTVGLGSTDPWHIPEVGTASEEAEKNRKVVLIDESTQEAQRILQNG